MPGTPMNPTTTHLPKFRETPDWLQYTQNIRWPKMMMLLEADRWCSAVMHLLLVYEIYGVKDLTYTRLLRR